MPKADRLNRFAAILLFLAAALALIDFAVEAAHGRFKLSLIAAAMFCVGFAGMALTRARRASRQRRG